MTRVCQWRGCIAPAEMVVFFDPTARPQIISGKLLPLKPLVYCWDHYCEVDDLFNVKGCILEEALLGSA